MKNILRKNITYALLLIICTSAFISHIFDKKDSANHGGARNITKDSKPDLEMLHGAESSQISKQDSPINSKNQSMEGEVDLIEKNVQKKTHAFKTTMSKGDTLYKVLLRADIPNTTSFNITRVINRLYSLSKLQTSDKIYIALTEDIHVQDIDQNKISKKSQINNINILINGRLFKLKWDPAKKSYTVISKNATIDQIYDFSSIKTTTSRKLNILKNDIKSLQNKQNIELKARGATINETYGNIRMVRGTLSSNNFITSLDRAKISQKIITKTAAILNKEVDIKKDLKNNGKFTILYEQSSRKLLYLSVDTKEHNKSLELYRFEDSGVVKFYHKNGKSVKQTLLTSPIHKAKISSLFGSRMHPILHYVRMHKGVDYKAPYGTPIMATGSGIVEKACHDRQYGKFIKIRHNTQYSTLYAHMSNFAKNIRQGAQIKQGQVIGFVGSTGLTNGHHVHYELLQNGAQINPTKNHPRLHSEIILAQKTHEFKNQKMNIDKMISYLNNKGEYLLANNTTTTVSIKNRATQKSTMDKKKIISFY